jgi:ATP-dependent DNA helicase RecG
MAAAGKVVNCLSIVNTPTQYFSNMAKQTGFDARKLMERAVEAMTHSIHEHRVDGKATPRVGAALYKADGTIETACRGELRWGDHAEFTLLERKNRNNRLDGAKLFATLEPCAPGARKHPKLCCAERIVLARIKEVWVGVEDPDPKVDRKGIKYLQDHGVRVTMFDRDLQEVIRSENKEFFAQALERAAEAEEEAKVGPLSVFENPVAHADLRDFSVEALSQYRTIAKIADPVGSDGFNRRLAQQGLLQNEGKKFIPSGFGLLLFGKSPRDVMPQAGLLGTIHYPNGKEEPRDFDEPQVFVPELALQWLKDKLPNTIERDKARRWDTNDAFYQLLRESVVNAIVHRDYSIAGAKCQLVVTPDTVVIRSPGGPVEPITLEQLNAFNAPMLSRNPVLHYVFAKMELAEERGLGLKSMRESAFRANLPPPKFSWDAPYLVLTLYRSLEGAISDLSPKLFARLNQVEIKSWQFMVGRKSVTSAELMSALGFDERKAQRVLKKLLDVGLIQRLGKGRATRYEMIRP